MGGDLLLLLLLLLGRRRRVFAALLLLQSVAPPPCPPAVCAASSGRGKKDTKTKERPRRCGRAEEKEPKNLGGRVAKSGGEGGAVATFLSLRGRQRWKKKGITKEEEDGEETKGDL